MHLELAAKRTVGVHYGTWILSDENYLDPPRELGVAAREAGVTSRVVPGQMGRTMVFPIHLEGESSGDSSPTGSEGGIKSLDGEKDLGSLDAAFREVRGGRSVVWR